MQFSSSSSSVPPPRAPFSSSSTSTSASLHQNAPPPILKIKPVPVGKIADDPEFSDYATDEEEGRGKKKGGKQKKEEAEKVEKVEEEEGEEEGEEFEVQPETIATVQMLYDLALRELKTVDFLKQMAGGELNVWLQRLSKFTDEELELLIRRMHSQSCIYADNMKNDDIRRKQLRKPAYGRLKKFDGYTEQQIGDLESIRRREIQKIDKRVNLLVFVLGGPDVQRMRLLVILPLLNEAWKRRREKFVSTSTSMSTSSASAAASAAAIVVVVEGGEEDATLWERLKKARRRAEARRRQKETDRGKGRMRLWKIRDWGFVDRDDRAAHAQNYTAVARVLKNEIEMPWAVKMKAHLAEESHKQLVEWQESLEPKKRGRKKKVEEIIPNASPEKLKEEEEYFKRLAEQPFYDDKKQRIEQSTRDLIEKL